MRSLRGKKAREITAKLPRAREEDEILLRLFAVYVNTMLGGVSVELEMEENATEST